MLYKLEYGKSEETIIRHARQNRQPLPAFIQNAPELNLGLQIYLQAFFDLESERPAGFSLSRSPGFAVRRYAKDYDFDEEQFEALDVFIRIMDNAYIDYCNKKHSNNE